MYAPPELGDVDNRTGDKARVGSAFVSSLDGIGAKRCDGILKHFLHSALDLETQAGLGIRFLTKYLEGNRWMHAAFICCGYRQPTLQIRPMSNVILWNIASLREFMRYDFRRRAMA
jgi:hypothetical protein